MTEREDQLIQSKWGFSTTLSRSGLMRKIKSNNTKPEVILRKALWACGIRYRLHSKTLPGKPDIILGRYRIAIFVDGEFWYGYEWDKKKVRMTSNKEYWIKKIERNIERDKRNNLLLQETGWKVFRFWQHEIKADLQGIVDEIITEINKHKNS